MTYPEKFKAQVVEYAEATTNSEAARRFDLPRQTVIRWMKSCGATSGYTPPAPLMVHGSPAMYQRHGCRCDQCRTAHNRRKYQMRRYRGLRLQQDPTLAPHGSASTYTNWGCRCDECRAAWSAYCTPERRAKAVAA